MRSFYTGQKIDEGCSVVGVCFVVSGVIVVVMMVMLLVFIVVVSVDVGDALGTIVVLN